MVLFVFPFSLLITDVFLEKFETVVVLLICLSWKVFCFHPVPREYNKLLNFRRVVIKSLKRVGKVFMWRRDPLVFM